MLDLVIVLLMALTVVVAGGYEGLEGRIRGVSALDSG